MGATYHQKKKNEWQLRNCLMCCD